MTRVAATIEYREILRALGLSEIAGQDRTALEDIEVTVDVAEDDLTVECDCDPGPESAVNPSLIRDFIAAINSGDLTTARCLVGRVFEIPEDVSFVDAAICRCAA